MATAFDWFAQDSWKATRKLTLEYGVRHSIWPPWKSRWGSLAEFLPQFYDPGESAGGRPAQAASSRAATRMTASSCPAAGVPTAEGNRFPVLHTGQFDRCIIAFPKVWRRRTIWCSSPASASRMRLTPKTALRAGVGMFANRTAINRDTALGGNAPFQPQTTVINGSADAPAGATPRLFPFTLTSQDPVFKIPVAWNWNATFQREIGWGTTVEVGYVGRRGMHNQRKRNINQLCPEPSRPTPV